MSSFKDRSWPQRYGQMGDISEGKFEEVCDNVLKRRYTRFGLNRPPIQVSRLPKRIRYAPDYLMSDKLVECQGFGRDQTLKLKLDKFNVLHFWNGVFRTEMFVYDSYNDRWAFVPILKLDDWLDEGRATLASFPEKKSYFAFDASLIFEDNDAEAA